MSTPYSKRHRASSWLMGAGVLIAIGVAVTWMLYEGGRKNRETTTASKQAASDNQPAAVPKLMSDVRSEQLASNVVVRGTVLLPNGLPAPSATVTLYRLLTAAPEWRKQRVVQAITRADGAFQFRCAHLHGFLLGFEHPGYAGNEVEVSLFGEPMQLQLRPGYSIGGTVLNDVGAPVPKARVSVESVHRDSRRARFTYTAADGTYSFSNLAAGAAELVARHDFWQPARATAVIIGERQRTDFRFSQPSMSPLRGRVLRAATQEPIAGATVELVPIDRQLGLVDPVSTTTAADGTFMLSGLPRGGLRLLVRHADYGSSRQRVSIRSAAKDVTVELPDRAILKGELAGAFTGGEILEVKEDEDIGSELAYTVVQPDGSFVFERKLSPGYVEFRVLGGEFLFQNLGGVSARELLEEPENGESPEVYLDVRKTSLVHGRLVDADGKPIQGARIESAVEGYGRVGAGAFQLDLDKMSDGLLNLMFGRAELLAISDEDGKFEIRGRRGGKMQTKISCVGFGNREVRMTVPEPGGVVEVADIVLEPGCRVSGRVVRGGQPFVGATVIVSSEQSSSLARTNQHGEYSISDLMPGVYDVDARISGRPTGSSDARRVTTLPDVPITDLDITLKAGRIISGVVTDKLRRPLRGALISLRGRSGEVITTKSAGKFEVELPAREVDGPVDLVVSFGDGSSQKIVPIMPGQKVTEVLLDAANTCTLMGRVAGLPGRRPLAGALLRWTELDKPRAQVISRWVETLGGELRHSHVPSGRLLVEVWAEGYAPYQQEWQLKPGEDNDLGEVLLAAGARLKGVVRDADGNPVRDAMVLLGDEADFALFLPTIHSDEDGAFTIQGVTSRSKQLVVRSPGFAANTVFLQLPRDVLSLDPLQIKMERGATIEVKVAASVTTDDGLVYLRRGGRLLGSTVLDDSGKAWFVNRSAGRYTVQLPGGDVLEQVVEVKAGQELSLVEFAERSK